MAKPPLTPAELAALRTLGYAGLEGLIGTRNARVFARYYRLFGEPGDTLAAIGEDHGISKERVRQVVQRARTRLGYVPV